MKIKLNEAVTADQIRQSMSGFVGSKFAKKASDEDIMKMVDFKDKIAKLHNTHILPIQKQIDALYKQYKIKSNKGIEESTSMNEIGYKDAVAQFNSELEKHPEVLKAAKHYGKKPAEIVKALQMRLSTKGDRGGDTKEVSIDFKDTDSNISIKHKKKFESVNESIKYNNDGFVTQMVNAAGKVVKDITLDGETFSLKGNKYVSKKGGKDLHKSHFGIGESVNEGKDDFVARHGKSNILLKKGYKHHTEGELEALYDKVGKLVKGLNVKDVNIVFEQASTSIQEVTVTRIPNFNLESDAYIIMLYLLKNNSGFKKVVSNAGIDLFSGANVKSVFTSLQNNLKKVITPQIVKAVVETMNQKRKVLFIDDMDIEKGVHNDRFAGLLALGVIDSFVNDPIDYKLIKDLDNAKLKGLADEFSMNRGKVKLAAMLGNKGF